MVLEKQIHGSFMSSYRPEKVRPVFPFFYKQHFQQDSVWRSVCCTGWPAVMKGPVLGSNHSTEVSLGQLKEKTVRPDNPRKLLLATTSTVSTWGGSSSCTSERRRLGLRRRGLSRPVQCLISKIYSSLKILSAGEHSSARMSSRKFNTVIVNYPLFQTCNQSFLLKIHFCLAFWGL